MSSGTSKLEIHEYPYARFERPNVVVGFPEVGLVGTIAASYLVQRLKLPELGYVESILEPAVVVIQKGEPKFPIRLFGGQNLVVFLSDIPLTPRFASELTNEIVKWSLRNKAQLLIGMTGIPSEERMDMEGAPKVFGATNIKEKDSMFKKLGLEYFDEGVLVGSYALLLKRCLISNQPNVTLLSEAHLQFPDPGAAAAIINALNPLLSINIDVKPLLEESEQIRLKMRELMNRTQQSMQQMTQQAAPRVYA